MLVNLVFTPLIFTVPLGLKFAPERTKDPPLYDPCKDDEVGDAIVTVTVEGQLLHPYDV